MDASLSSTIGANELSIEINGLVGDGAPGERCFYAASACFAESLCLFGVCQQV